MITRFFLAVRLIGFFAVGFSVFSERTGYGTPTFAQRSMEVTPGYETVDMSMDPSGNVEVRIGASPHGQGLVTTLSQLVADELGIDPESVTTALCSQVDATSFMGHPYTCDGRQLEGLPAMCSPQQILAELRDGQLEQIGTWVDVGAIYGAG